MKDDEFETMRRLSLCCSRFGITSEWIQK